MNPCLPDFVATIIESLSQDETTKSIWLVGSRANGYAKENSDWDLVVFSFNEPTITTNRHQNVDVIQVGPSGTFLLEGKNLEFLLSFANWNWKQVSDGEATYTSLDFAEPHLSNTIHDSTSISSLLRNALKLWP
jgi:hypothetical protein